MSQGSEEIEFAKKIIEVFKAQSFDTYKKFLLSKPDLEEFANDKGMTQGLNSEELMRKNVADFDQHIDSGYRDQFNRLIKKGEEIGIDWPGISFLKFIFKVDHPENSTRKFLSGHINFMYRDSVYLLFGIEATETKAGFKINMISTVLKGGLDEFVDPDLLDEEDR